MNRTDLIEHLCTVQHVAYEQAEIDSDWITLTQRWERVAPEKRALIRASMTCVLQELETLGMGTFPQ